MVIASLFELSGRIRIILFGRFQPCSIDAWKFTAAANDCAQRVSYQTENGTPNVQSTSAYEDDEKS